MTKNLTSNLMEREGVRIIITLSHMHNHKQTKT